jgi:hypothetical protein
MKKKIPLKKINRYTEKQLNKAYRAGMVTLTDYIKRRSIILRKHG